MVCNIFFYFIVAFVVFDTRMAVRFDRQNERKKWDKQQQQQQQKRIKKAPLFHKLNPTKAPDRTFHKVFLI